MTHAPFQFLIPVQDVDAVGVRRHRLGILLSLHRAVALLCKQVPRLCSGRESHVVVRGWYGVLGLRGLIVQVYMRTTRQKIRSPLLDLAWTT